MKAHDKNPALLPSGFVDLLPPEAEREAVAISVLMKTFAGFGYQRVKPPLVEFEESLFAPGPGSALTGETFRLMDPVSHRMMGLRSDTTAQIARISASRLGGEERPLRLTYANDVLRTKGSQQRTERQFCQVGCEIIGHDGSETDIEACVVSLVALSALGVKSMTIDIAMPCIVESILESCNEKENIREILDKKDADGIDALEDKELSGILIGLLNASGSGDKALAILASLALQDEVKEYVEKLKSVYGGVQKAVSELGLEDISITIDPVERKGFEYHCGVAFTLFAKGISGELGRGGRYNINFGNDNFLESATGFTLYMDTIRKAMPEAEGKEVVLVSHEESWQEIASLQSQGKIVVRGTGQE